MDQAGPSGQKRLFLMPGKSAEFTISKGEFMSFGPFPGYEKDPLRSNPAKVAKPAKRREIQPATYVSFWARAGLRRICML